MKRKVVSVLVAPSVAGRCRMMLLRGAFVLIRQPLGHYRGESCSLSPLASRACSGMPAFHRSNPIETCVCASLIIACRFNMKVYLVTCVLLFALLLLLSAQRTLCFSYFIRPYVPLHRVCRRSLILQVG